MSDHNNSNQTMSIYKVHTCEHCNQYKEDCACCDTCGLPEGHFSKVCPEIAFADTLLSAAVPVHSTPKTSYIKTLIGVGAKKHG